MEVKKTINNLLRCLSSVTAYSPRGIKWTKFAVVPELIFLKIPRRTSRTLKIFFLRPLSDYIFFVLILISKIHYPFAFGFRSVLWGWVLSCQGALYNKQCFVAFAVYFGTLSCWKMNIFLDPKYHDYCILVVL